MKEIQVSIPEDEFERLNALYPASEKSFTVGDRAIEIVEYYFRNSVSRNCGFTRCPRPGIDLAITYDGVTEEIEIKGTARPDLAWSQFKVSGQPSYNNLINDTPLYRVVGVNSRDPKIIVMKYSEDFDIEPEPRWTVKPKRARP